MNWRFWRRDKTPDAEAVRAYHEAQALLRRQRARAGEVNRAVDDFTRAIEASMRTKRPR